MCVTPQLMGCSEDSASRKPIVSVGASSLVIRRSVRRVGQVTTWLAANVNQRAVRANCEVQLGSVLRRPIAKGELAFQVIQAVA